MTHLAEAIVRAWETFIEKVHHMSDQLDALKQQVATNTSVIESASILIQGIAAKITAAGTDPAKLAELTAQLKASDDALSAAVASATPAADPASPPTAQPATGQPATGQPAPGQPASAATDPQAALDPAHADQPSAG
jgi:cell division septum initiation protein DivIVA